DGEVRTQGELLMNGGHAAPPRIRLVARRERSVVQTHRARVRWERAGEDVHERALSRAVLADERVDLSGAHLEVDARERRRRAESLGNAGELEQRRVLYFRYSSRGGERSFWDAGASRFAGVIKVT